MTDTYPIHILNLEKLSEDELFNYIKDIITAPGKLTPLQREQLKQIHQEFERRDEDASKSNK